MLTYTKTLILGNVGRAPDLQYLPDGRAVATFSVAVNRKWTDRQSQEHRETTWFRVKTWGRLAELCRERLQKSDKVFIEGRLDPDWDTGSPHIWYTDEDEPRANYDVTALHVSFISDLKSRDNDEGEE